MWISRTGRGGECGSVSGDMRIAFVSHQSRWWRKQRLAAKYLKMRLEGVIYPDVYCLAFMLADRFDFLLENEKVGHGKYDLILAELGASEGQLRYLEALVEAGNPPVAVIPGPPAILSRELTEVKLGRVLRILRGARHVWAYSRELKSFCDGLAGGERAVVIPWPYDFAATRKLASGAGFGRTVRRHNGEKRRILVQVPMIFRGVTQNHPFVLKGVLSDVWRGLPEGTRERISFHTFVYDAGDAEAYKASEFALGLPFRLEKKMGYRVFLRFLAGCEGVINLTSGSILGRITYLAGALGRPGIFSDNCEVNARLYPGSTVGMFDTARMRQLAGDLLRGAGSAGYPGLLPSEGAAAELGDFAENRRRLRVLAEGGL